MQTIVSRLSGGHPNSLGNTVSVATDVLLDESQQLMDELCSAYGSGDELVRLRVSSALKRVCGLHRESLPKSIAPKPEWIVRRFDWLIDDIGWGLDQPSAKWSIAQITQELFPQLTPDQRAKAIKLLKHNLASEPDWIVQIMTATALADIAQRDHTLRRWLLPRLKTMTRDPRKSVSAKAKKLYLQLNPAVRTD